MLTQRSYQFINVRLELNLEEYKYKLGLVEYHINMGFASTSTLVCNKIGGSGPPHVESILLQTRVLKIGN